MLALAACGSSDSDEPSADEPVEITWYTNMAPEAQEVLLDAFAKAHPEIKVKVYEGAVTGDMWQRFQAENAAGRNVADVIDVSDSGLMYQAKEDGLLAQGLPDSVQEAVDSGVIPERYVDPDGYFWATRFLFITVVYNPDAVPADVAPKTWMDLTDPWWGTEGQLGILDPSKTASYNALYAMDGEGLLEPLIKGMAPLKPKLYDSGGSLLAALTSGEIDGGFTADYALWVAQDKGQSVKVVYPPEGVGGWSDDWAVPAKAPHPEEGRTFADFVSSKEGAELVAESSYYYMVRTDVPPFPADKPPITDLNVLPFDPVAAAAGREELVTKVLGWLEEG